MRFLTAKSFRLFLALTVTSIWPSAKAQPLPAYGIHLAEEDLAALLRNPESDNYVPAIFTVDAAAYNCEVRFRGGSARTLPKKSWRVKFPNANNPFNAEHINLNAEYRDKSLLRNFLAMQLFHHNNLPAPHTRHVTLAVNGGNPAVYLQVQDVGPEFLLDNNINATTLYQAVRHGASLAPLVYTAAYNDSWEKKLGPAEDFSDLQKLSAQIFYWQPDEFIDRIATVVDVEQFLHYTAIEYAITCLDNFTKNYYFAFDDQNRRWQIIPWDNDTSFGNDIRGNYQNEYAEIKTWTPLHNQTLFQRLIESEDWRNFFEEKLALVVSEGFDFTENLLDSTYLAIQQEVYADATRRGSNAEFDAEKTRIKTYLDRRRAFLANGSPINRTPIRGYFCSNDFPTQENQEVTFRVQADKAAAIRLIYSTDLNWEKPGTAYTVKSLPLFDDGQHNDSLTGDLVYGNSLSTAGLSAGLAPFAYQVDSLNAPANGLFYMNNAPTHTFALRVCEKNPRLHERLQFGAIYQQDKNLFVELVNKSAQPLDVSYCRLQAGAHFQQFLFPPNTIISSRDTLTISSLAAFSNPDFHPDAMIGSFFFDIAVGDTIRILSPTLSPLITTVCTTLTEQQFSSIPLVINEINFNSSPEVECGDWLEVYNPEFTTVDAGNFYFKDDDDSHIFYLPPGTTIAPQGYLVFCEDTVALKKYHPNVTNCAGNFTFGLNSGSETLRLYDAFGNLLDSLTYYSRAPWPEGADGSGKTLELVDPFLDNAAPANWRVSEGNGTPQRRNSVYTRIERPNDRPHTFRLAQNYPNPFNQATRITFSAPASGFVCIKIFNINGRLVQSLKATSAQDFVVWDASGLPSGVYHYQLAVNGKPMMTKKALLLK